LFVLALARGGDLPSAKAQLDEAVRWAREEAKRLGDESLRKQADELAALKKELAGLVPTALGPVAAGPNPFPGTDASIQPSPASARAVREAHSAAFNDLH
jgi:hypothetical protein